MGHSLQLDTPLEGFLEIALKTGKLTPQFADIGQIVDIVAVYFFIVFCRIEGQGSGLIVFYTYIIFCQPDLVLFMPVRIHIGFFRTTLHRIFAENGIPLCQDCVKSLVMVLGHQGLTKVTVYLDKSAYFPVNGIFRDSQTEVFLCFFVLAKV